MADKCQCSAPPEIWNFKTMEGSKRLIYREFGLNVETFGARIPKQIAHDERLLNLSVSTSQNNRTPDAVGAVEWHYTALLEWRRSTDRCPAVVSYSASLPCRPTVKGRLM